MSRQARGNEGIDRIIQTDVALDELFVGLPGDDTRLRDALESLLHAR
ncbi:hypothetical protein LJN51_05010 [Cellulomonas sp. zg-B12]|nr:hypothetical protein [Cellulomonas xiejunii]